MEVPVLAAVAAFLVVVLLVIVYLSIRVVQQYEKMVVFRLGRTNEKHGPRPGPAVPRPDHRPAGQGGRARAVHRGSQPDHDHQGQRPDQRRLPDLLADLRPAQERGQRRQLPGRPPGRGDHDAPRGHRRHPARRGPVQARADQRGAAHQARRGDRALGRQGDHGRDPRDHPAARRPGRDEPAALGRADAARRHHRVGRLAPGRDQRGRGPEAVRDPQGRGRAAGGDPAGRGLQRGADPDLQGGHRRRPEDDVAPVPRGAQGAGRRARHEVHHPDGVHPAARSVPRVPGARARSKPGPRPRPRRDPSRTAGRRRRGRLDRVARRR